MTNENVKQFLDSCDELINCKYLVAEYKIQKLLRALANSDQVCSLISECLEQFNRDREFAKAYIQDGHGDFIYISPVEEFKIIALVFCTLVDIDSKKIDFIDFIKRFFGREENPFQTFIQEMIIPFRNLIAEVFGENVNNSEIKEDVGDTSDEGEFNDEDEEESDVDADTYVQAEKIAVQILTQLEFSKQDYQTEVVMQICRAIIKTSKMQDEDVMMSLIYALKNCKEKQVKYLMKELIELFY